MMSMDSSSIGNYRLIKEIARGTSSIVYLAQHSHLTHRIVAIKLLQLTYLPTQQDRDDFLREASVLEHLKHLYILPVYEVGIHEGYPYIIAEYAANGSLKERLQMNAPGTLPAREIMRTLTYVGQALVFAHQRNILHRDLKPANILYNSNGDAQVADFHIASQSEQTGMPHDDNSDTFYYMAPEQFEGIVSKKSDQYALGCIAYEMVTGQRPFSGLDRHVLAIKHANETPVPPTQFNQRLPTYIEAAILKAMAKDPDSRYEDVQALLLALGNQQSTMIQAAPSPTLSLSETNAPTIPSSQLAPSIVSPVEQTPRAITPIPPAHAVSQPVSSPGVAAEQYFPKEMTSTPAASEIYLAPQPPYDSQGRIAGLNAPGRYDAASVNPSFAPVIQESNVVAGAFVPTPPPLQGPESGPFTGANYNVTPPVNQQRDGKRHSKRGLFILLASIILAILLIGSGTLFALSKLTGNGNHTTPAMAAAMVTITPVSQLLQKTFTILEVTGNPDSSQQQVGGAHFITFTTPTQSSTVNATGQGTSKPVEATGVLTYTSHLASAVTFGAGSTVTSSSPNIVAVITQTRTLNPGQTLTFTAYISSPTGSHSNIAAGALNGTYCLSDPSCPGDNKYITITSSAFGGGKDPQPYTYVQQSDITAAQSQAAAMEPAMEQQARAQINAQLTSQERLIGTPTCTPDVTANHSPGDAASTVTASVFVQCTGEAYNPQNALALAQTLLVSDPSYAFVGKVTTTLQQVQKPNAQGIIPIVYQSEGLEVYQFSDSYKQTLISAIAGKSMRAARAFLLTQMGVKDVKMKLTGGQGNTLPTKVGQITISIASPT